MPPYKNQHYVPQFYMRNFTSGDSDRVYLFNFENQREFHDSTRNVCSDSWFYDDDMVRESEYDAVIEKRLGGIESGFAPAIETLLDEQRFDRLSPETIQSLLRFISFQAFRTPGPIEHFEQVADFIATKEAREHLEQSDLPDEQREVLSQTNWTTNAPVKMWTVVQTLTAKDLMYDLEPVVLLNKSERGFVFSEEPVVLDNRRFKNEYDAPLVGLQNSGLQVFAPFSPSLLLLLYDPACYQVDYDNAEQKVVYITNESTVDCLNKLQFVNGHANVFYGDEDRESEMVEVYDDIAENIKWERRKTPNNCPPNIVPQDDRAVRMPPPYSPTLPFVRQRLSAGIRMFRHPELWHRVTNRWKEMFDNWG